jgi:hypothetical protein
MRKKNARISREHDTVAVMIALYCCRYHLADGLCMQCEEILEYAHERLDKCPFREGKTICTKCPVHCYRPEMRQKVRIIMRYSGPRMLYKYPVMAIQHFFDGWRKEPLHMIKK